MLLADDFDARCGLDVVEMILTECIYIVLAFTGSLVAWSEVVVVLPGRAYRFTPWQDRWEAVVAVIGH